MGYIRDYADRIDLAAMTPQGSLSSTAHALANRAGGNAEFLIYSPFGGDFTVDLSGSSGQFMVEWMDPATGLKTPGPSVTGGATRIFTPPFGGFGGDSVLYLKRAVAPQLRLSVMRADPDVVIWWPVSFTNAVLESSLGLSVPDWGADPAPVIVVDTNYTVTVAATNGAMFYRLRQ